MINPFYVDSRDIDDQYRSQQLNSALGNLGNTANLYSQFGPIGAAVGGAFLGADLIGNSIRRRKDENRLIDDLNQFSTPGIKSDVYGNPIYNLGQSFSNLNNLSTDKIGKDSSLLGADDIFGGKKRRRRAERARENALKRVSNFQEDFNRMNLTSANLNATREEYADNVQDRYNRLYSLPNMFS
jgi:hypothetical protein